MPTSHDADQQINLTISLTEVNDLRKKVSDLELEIITLRKENEDLKQQLAEIQDPKRAADAKAFRRSRGYD